MNWMAAYEQREEAPTRVFYMLIATVLMTLRAGMDSRRASIFFPYERLSRNDARSIDNRLSRDEVRVAVVRLLLAAELALQRLSTMMRAVYELMNHAHTLAGRRHEQACMPPNQCAQPAKRLDSS